MLKLRFSIISYKVTTSGMLLRLVMEKDLKKQHKWHLIAIIRGQNLLSNYHQLIQLDYLYFLIILCSVMRMLDRKSKLQKLQIRHMKMPLKTQIKQIKLKLKNQQQFQSLLRKILVNGNRNLRRQRMALKIYSVSKTLKHNL